MKYRYRPLYIVIVGVVLGAFLFLDKNIGLAAFTEELFISSCTRFTLPGMEYYYEPHKLEGSTIFDGMLKSAVPVSAMLPRNKDDYIMLADNSCDYDNAAIPNNTTSDIQTENAEKQQTQKAEEEVRNARDIQNTSGNIAPKTNNAVSEAIMKTEVTGKVYNRLELSDYGFVHNHFYTITSITELTETMLRPAEFIDKNLAIDKTDSSPKILIFHTHSQEGFTDTVENDTSTTIVGVGDYLTELLTQKYGYNVIHDTSVYDYVDGRLDRSKAYTYAENGIARILEENPSIEVVIDLHRDGVADTTHLVTEVDGKSMAKIMFFNGLSYSKVNGDIAYLNNPYRDDNLAMSLQMQLLGEAYYPGFLRRIYVNAYRYCLHERGRSMLIEAGAQTNTCEEVKNAMEPLADILNKLLSGEKVIQQ